MAGITGRVILICAALLLARPALAVSLVADLSSHLVSITTGFAGTDVLLFGAIEDLPGGSDVVVVIRGPERQEIVRRKDRHLGIWVNSDHAVIQNAPTFYHVAASRGLDHIAAQSLLQDYRIGVDNLRLKSAANTPASDEFRQALIRLKQKTGLYGDGVRPVGFLDDRLFRTDIHIPSNVPVGVYRVDVYQIAGGKVMDAKTTPLIVSKTGLGATIFDFAHQHGALYGVAAIALAALAGWIAALAFRR